MAVNYTKPTGRTREQISTAVDTTRERQRAEVDEYNTYRDQEQEKGNQVSGYSATKSKQGAYTPTVLSDTSIRDKKIPQLRQDSTDTLFKYDQNRGLIEQGNQMQEDRANEQKKNADPLETLYGNSLEAPPDPYTQKQLDLIDNLLKSSDASTRSTAAHIQETYDRQRSQQNGIAAREAATLGTSVDRLGGRYTPGARSMVIANSQQRNLEKLKDIDTDESYAMEQLRQAQENNDYQLVGKKLDALKGIRDDRIKAIDDIRKEQQKREDDNRKDVNEVLTSAAKNGAPGDILAAIGSSGDVSDAVQAAGEYLQDGEYAEYKRAALSSGTTPVDASTYYARKIYGDSAFGGDDPLQGDIPFQATIEGAASYAGSVTGEASAQKQLASLAKSGDYPALLTRMEGLARKGMGAAPGAEVAAAQNQIKALDNMSNVLKQYKALGGDIGFLKGNEQQIAAKVGKLATDPRFASISTQLTAAFQQYRQQMSGAAFGAAESAQYKSVVPSADKSFELNDAVMDGLKNFFTQTVNGAYETQLGEGYTNLKEYVDKGLTPTGALLIKNETQAQDKVRSLGATDPELQQKFQGLLQSRPDISYTDLLKVAGFDVSDGSRPVSMADSDPSKGVIGGYDIKSYATDPNHEKRISAIYSKTGNINDAASAEQYIKSIAPRSPVTGDQVMAAAREKDVSPGMILALMQQDSTFGTMGKAVRTKNPGNVGNTDSGATQAFPDWYQGVLAVANNLAKRKVG